MKVFNVILNEKEKETLEKEVSFHTMKFDIFIFNDPGCQLDQDIVLNL